MGISFHFANLTEWYISFVMLCLGSAEMDGDVISGSCVFYFSLPELQLTLKAPITTAADFIHKHFFIVFQRK